eukprot:CAMPEP_0174976748 /NCGR_PEP_ID=MMETSP0004_2-20121128/13202_1 /TAXON_ID=420556 /ORGANISM="Ochromonas sp., Strain CCMP1393" /LENGTH=444 /DNA_ID=CAMNT_0016227807 /DNA_START=441 /DNA_END=1775 /DNA_ORIENTATION=-
MSGGWDSALCSTALETYFCVSFPPERQQSGVSIVRKLLDLAALHVTWLHENNKELSEISHLNTTLNLLFRSAIELRNYTEVANALRGIALMNMNEKTQNITRAYGLLQINQDTSIKGLSKCLSDFIPFHADDNRISRLLAMGFTPEEADLIGNASIGIGIPGSRSPIRDLVVDMTCFYLYAVVVGHQINKIGHDSTRVLHDMLQGNATSSTSSSSAAVMVQTNSTSSGPVTFPTPSTGDTAQELAALQAQMAEIVARLGPMPLSPAAATEALTGTGNSSSAAPLDVRSQVAGMQAQLSALAARLNAAPPSAAVPVTTVETFPLLPAPVTTASPPAGLIPPPPSLQDLGISNTNNAQLAALTTTFSGTPWQATSQTWSQDRARREALIAGNYKETVRFVERYTEWCNAHNIPAFPMSYETVGDFLCHLVDTRNGSAKSVGNNISP